MRSCCVDDLPDLRLALFQHKAWNETYEARLNWLDMVAERARGDGSTLLLAPAQFFSGDGESDRPPPSRPELEQRLGEIAGLHGLALVVGYPEAAGDRLFDAALALGPDGAVLANGRRMHLPEPGGAARFALGQDLALFEHAGWRMALLVGSDIEFPEAARAAAVAGAELLLVPHDLDQGRARVAETLAPARAAENGVWLALANYCSENGPGGGHLGGSRVIAPDGSTEAIAGRGQEIVTAVLSRGRIAHARARVDYLRHRRVFEG